VIKYFLLPTILLVFLSACGQNSITDKIVVVNIHNYDREGIARQIQNVRALNPKVIALDIQFSSLKDKNIDSVLRMTLESCDNLVMASVIRNYTHEDKNYEDTLGCMPYFLTNAKTGFINAILEDDTFQTLKRFSIKEKVNGKIEYHFAIRTAMAFDSLKTVDFMKDKPKIIDVAYQKDQTKIKVLGARDALDGNLKRKDIEGKIVIFGTFWIFEDDPDIFVSPLNQEKERYRPDMWGVMYLANIVAQVLE